MEFQVRYFLILVLTNTFISQSIASRYCVTARGELGKCTAIISCPYMLKIQNMVNSQPEYATYFQHSHCPKTKKSQMEIMICCPAEPLSLFNIATNLNYNSVLPEYCRMNNGRQIHRRELPTTKKHRLEPHIANGDPTQPDEHPWMAVVEYMTTKGKESRCSGSLISKRYVLSAAHCFHKDQLQKGMKAINIHLGEHDKYQVRDCPSKGPKDRFIWDRTDCADPVLTIPIEEITIHEDYRKINGIPINDIALVRLARPVKRITHYIQPICLPQHSDIERTLFTAGWGLTEEGVFSDQKLKATLPLIGMDKCASMLKNDGFKPEFGMFCTGSNNGENACKGDSGGPIMAEIGGRYTKKNVLFGVHSFGPSRCGVEGVSGVHTKVFDFLPWILNNLKV